MFKDSEASLSDHKTRAEFQRTEKSSSHPVSLPYLWELERPGNLVHFLEGAQGAALLFPQVVDCIS